MSFLILLLVVFISWTLYNAYCLLINYRRASLLNIPIVCVPVTPDKPVWIAFQTAFSPVVNLFPFERFAFTRYCRLGWEFHDRYETHLRLGDVWMLVTPHRNWIYIAEADASREIFSRNRDFGRPVWMLDMLNVFGPNVSTAEGSDWQRQRKLTATPFNEQKSSLVWAESLRQANDMVHFWTSHNSRAVETTSEDTRTVALHVLAYAGFQKSYPFGSIGKSFSSEQSSIYRDSVSIILKNIFLILVLPSWVFQVPILPSKWTQVGWAITEFKQYMLSQLAIEQQLMAEGSPGSGTLLSNLVRASNANSVTGRKDMSGESVPRTVHDLKALSVNEILGNIFVFNFAGHDTTATSLNYSILLLAAHPECQAWISEELNFHLANESFEDWEYETSFLKLQRCLAVLLETLRLYNPLPGIPKFTGHRFQALQVGQKTITVPPDTLVTPMLQALHTHPRYWGQDSLVWRPSRWIVSSSDHMDTDLGARLLRERLFIPQRGTFIAWSEGARNCPGKKFAQVEHVAIMAALFRDYQATPATKRGETQEGARKRVLDIVKDSNVELLLQMRNPGSVSIKWSHK